MLITPLRFECCFHCSTYSNTLKIDKLLEAQLPTEGVWLNTQEKLLLPILKRVAQASRGIMPMRWVDKHTPLPERDSLKLETESNKRRMRMHFWDLCHMARHTFDQYQSEDIHHTSFIHNFVRIAEVTLNLMTHGREQLIQRKSQEAMHLWFQIQLLKNEDVVLDTIYNLTSRNTTTTWQVRARCQSDKATR
jgi:hypothetical protein